MKTDHIPPVFRLKTVYYILPFWLSLLIGLQGALTSNDLGYYLKLGEAMIKNKAIISHDIFTHTFFGLQYVNSGWLSQVVLAWCEHVRGLESLIILRAALLLLTISILYTMVSRKTRNYKITFCFIVFAAAVGFTNWSLRPQLFIFPLFVFFYRYLFDKEKITRSSILLLSLLMILWINLHNSFPLAIMLTGIFLLGKTADTYLNNTGTTIKEKIKNLTGDSRLRRLFLLALILTTVTFINPYGIHIWKDVWTNSSISIIRSVEWQPTAMKDFTGYCFVVSLVLASIVLKLSKRKLTVTEALLLLVFLFAGFKASRMVMWWGIIAAPILAGHFCSIPWVQQKISEGKKQERSEDEFLPLNIILLIVMLISVISFLPWLRPYHPIKRARDFINPRTEPIAIADYIKKEGLKGNMYNDINWGSYLIWKLWPEYRVFADNRLHLVPEAIWKDSKDVHFGLGNWETILNKYKISFVVLSKKHNKKIIGFIEDSPRWEKVYEDETGAVFVKK